MTPLTYFSLTGNRVLNVKVNVRNHVHFWWSFLYNRYVYLNFHWGCCLITSYACNFILIIMIPTFAPISTAFPLSARPSPHLWGFIVVICVIFWDPLQSFTQESPPRLKLLVDPFTNRQDPIFHTWSRALSSVHSLFHGKFCTESRRPPRYLSNTTFQPGSSVWVLLRQDACRPAWPGTHCIGRHLGHLSLSLHPLSVAITAVSQHPQFCVDLEI